MTPVYTITGGKSVNFLESLREIWQFRPLIAELVRRDLKVRYKNRVGGILWSLFSPLAQVLTITLMVKFFLTPVTNYSAYLMAVMYLWQFFQNALLDSSQSLLTNSSLARKLYFPRAILPIVTLLSNLLHFGISFAFIMVYFFVVPISDPIYPQNLSWQFLWVLPLVVGVSILALGLGFLMAQISTLYDDVRFLSGTALGLFFYALPILYPIEKVAAKSSIYPIYMLNPMASFLVGFQRALLPPPVVKDGDVVLQSVGMPYEFLAIAGVVSVLTLLGGFWVFERSKWTMMERI